MVGGNHDLEGIDEFPTDETNMESYLSILGKPTPYFRRDIADKVVLLGLGSTAFRTAQYTSHEVYIDVRLNGGVCCVLLSMGDFAWCFLAFACALPFVLISFSLISILFLFR